MTILKAMVLALFIIVSISVFSYIGLKILSEFCEIYVESHPDDFFYYEGKIGILNETTKNRIIAWLALFN
jgi:hypothetical protein